MNADALIVQEVQELRLLVKGLSRIEAFPAELLKLMVAKLDRLENLLASVPVEMSFASEEQLVQPTTSEEQPVQSTVQEHHEPRKEKVPSTSEGRLEHIKVSLTLNDRFLFQRELFGNNPQRMAAFFGELSQLSSLPEASTLLKTYCPDSEQTEGHAALTALMEQWFPAPTGL